MTNSSFAAWQESGNYADQVEIVEYISEKTKTRHELHSVLARKGCIHLSNFSSVEASDSINQTHTLSQIFPPPSLQPCRSARLGSTQPSISPCVSVAV